MGRPKKLVQTEPNKEDVAVCCHHWVIDIAAGPISQGVCQICGEVKEFRNSLEYEAEWISRKDVALAMRTKLEIEDPDGDLLDE